MAERGIFETLVESGRPEEALLKFEAVSGFETPTAEVYRLIGRAYQDLGNSESAIDAYHQSIRLDHDDGWSLNNLGVLFIDEGRPGEALGPLSRAVRVKPGVALVHNNLGMALELSGYFVGATEQYRLAVEAVPIRLSVELGRVRLAMGEVRQWKPGDVVVLGTPSESDLAMRLGERARYRVRPGRRGRRLAVEILSEGRR